MKTWLWTAGSILALDQGSKAVLPVLALNQGISFGLGGAWVTAVVVVLSCGVAWYLHPWRRQSWWYQAAAGGVLGGAASNIVDRLFLGGVRDVWSVPFIPLYNNLADWAIVLGVLALLVGSWYETIAHDSHTL